MIHISSSPADSLWIPQTFVGLCNQFPAQIVALAAQVSWSGSVLTALKASQAGTAGGLTACLEGLAWRLLAMSESVLGESPPALRKKYEQLITELVRQRDATRRLKVKREAVYRMVRLLFGQSMGRLWCHATCWHGF